MVAHESHNKLLCTLPSSVADDKHPLEPLHPTKCRLIRDLIYALLTMHIIMVHTHAHTLTHSHRQDQELGLELELEQELELELEQDRKLSSLPAWQLSSSDFLTMMPSISMVALIRGTSVATSND